ncbi:hypothetical protein [uncultured Endozoicomonas sp.]|uniref:hypothetical protein n=1 Tax=uncultured Endozoicomonas sp. TaxID=432652 RepID=UPI002613FE4F|nr:hypothetical protein [uncultured Endozoicomonas sp.]
MMNKSTPPAKQSMDYAQLLEALNQASTFDLFRLSSMINRELDSSERIDRIKAALTIGQKLSYFDSNSNSLHDCEVLQLNQKRALVLDFSDGKRWKVPYYTLNLEGADVRIHHEAEEGLSRHAISVGDVLGFKDKHGREHFGHVLRLNTQTVTLKVEEVQWRVGYMFLYRVLEGQGDQEGELLIEGERAEQHDEVNQGTLLE